MTSYKVTYYMTPRQAYVQYDRLLDKYDLKLPYGKSHTALFAMLHEYAHISLRHFSEQEQHRCGYAADSERELAASQLALKWIKPTLWAKAYCFYLSCLAKSGIYRASYRQEIARKLAQ